MRKKRIKKCLCMSVAAAMISGGGQIRGEELSAVPDETYEEAQEESYEETWAVEEVPAEQETYEETGEDSYGEDSYGETETETPPAEVPEAEEETVPDEEPEAEAETEVSETPAVPDPSAMPEQIEEREAYEEETLSDVSADAAADITPVPEAIATVSPSPDVPGLSPEVSPSPSPAEEPEAAETPVPVSPAGINDAEKAVENLVNRIEALKAEKVTTLLRKKVEAIRTIYDGFTEAQKSKVTNYEDFVKIEEQVKELLRQSEELSSKISSDLLTDGTLASILSGGLIGTPVYFTNMVSNLHAGKEFYLNSLKNNYQLSFEENFASVMESIEKEYREKNGLKDISRESARERNEESAGLLVRNWQDILAIYVYQRSLNGAEEFRLSADSRAELAAIFAEMNPVVKNGEEEQKSLGNRHISYYIKKNNLDKKARAVLEKYVETDCSLLCAVVTASDGFIRQSVGEDVSEERIEVISAAYSLIGKVGYFWGGKSLAIGVDSEWGSAAQVTAEGSKSTGTVRAFGLDCSGFVTWAVINGYKDSDMVYYVGTGTSDQWDKARVVSEADARPGDLVFQRGPEAGSDNHVGILCGKTASGDWIAVHCSSLKNGVTVGEAYGASFRYIRQPSFYVDELAAEEKTTTEAKEKVKIRTNVEQIAVAEAGESLTSEELLTSEMVPLAQPASDKTGSRKTAADSVVTVNIPAENAVSVPADTRPSMNVVVLQPEIITVQIPKDLLTDSVNASEESRIEEGTPEVAAPFNSLPAENLPSLNVEIFSGEDLTSGDGEIFTVEYILDDSEVDS